MHRYRKPGSCCRSTGRRYRHRSRRRRRFREWSCRTAPATSARRFRRAGFAPAPARCRASRGNRRSRRNVWRRWRRDRCCRRRAWLSVIVPSLLLVGSAFHCCGAVIVPVALKLSWAACAADQLGAGTGEYRDLVVAALDDANVHQFGQLVDVLVALIFQRAAMRVGPTSGARQLLIDSWRSAAGRCWPAGRRRRCPGRPGCAAIGCCWSRC